MESIHDIKSPPDILELEKALSKLEHLNASFDYLRITIASPERIRSWAQRCLPDGEVVGEVLKPETINFRTHQPELHGLFCEKIFGPIKNWKCQCGKYNGFALDKICEVCKVEITEARVRRYRMGYIELTCPIAHFWYLNAVPNYILILLSSILSPSRVTKDNRNLNLKDIMSVVYFHAAENIIDSKNLFYRYFMKNQSTELDNSSTLDDFFRNTKFAKLASKEDYENNQLSLYFKQSLTPQMSFNFERFKKKRRGAEILKAALEDIDIEHEIKKSRNKIITERLAKINDNPYQEKKLFPDKKEIRRIRVLESFLVTKTNPGWMVLTVLPILPPNLRPLLELENGRLVAADVNEIYRLIITRNQRLFDFSYNYMTPELITVHGRKLLQESIDCLIDNGRLPKERTFFLNNKPLKSLTEILEGKQGRFRQSLLGKRVDYSGRSVIIVGPHLRLNQCGLPYEMAVELFQPFLINELLKTKIKFPSHNTKLAQLIIKKNKPFIWTLLIALTRKHSILLNRAPTLHRFGIQAFDPLMVLGQAIHLHPLVCTGFNADFDGDQMAIHLPLYQSSQLEARSMMRPSFNVLSPSNGDVILKPTQDMVIGCYYLTIMINKNKGKIQKWFGNENEALSSFYQKKLMIHSPILVRYSMDNFLIKVEKGKVLFIDTVTYLNVNRKEIFVYKTFEFDIFSEKYYLITNIGILIARAIEEDTYQLTDLFLETSPGRLIFSTNFKNSIEIRKYAT